MPGVPAAQADDKILFGQPKRPQRVNQQRNQFRVRRRIGFADEVGVELEMFAQPAFLLALVAEQLRDGEPFDGFLVIAFVRGDHARQRRRHFRPERDGAVAFVGEIVKLADDFVAAFGGEQFERFERRAVVFAEAVAPGGFTPFVENVLAGVKTPSRVAGRQGFGIKIAETGQSFHKSAAKKHKIRKN